jgi:hypothetical protein
MILLLKVLKEFEAAVEKIWPLGVVIGSGVVTFTVGLKLSSETARTLSTAVLVTTLVAVTWYSLETRILRLQQQWNNEVRNHPWLKGSDLKVDRGDTDIKTLWREIVYLPIQNVGTTPAHDLNLAVKWRVEGDEASTGEKRIGSVDLPPGDTCHPKLCEIDFDPGDKAFIDVEITYKGFAGGGGRLKMNFYTHEKGWANGPMSPYEFWLSDGRRFPAAGSLSSEQNL